MRVKLKASSFSIQEITIMFHVLRAAAGLFGIGAVCIAPLASLGQVTVTSAPKPQETVHVRVAPLPLNADAFDPAKRQITMNGNRITIEFGSFATFVVVPPPTPAIDIEIGQFPMGDYEVEVRRQVNDIGATETIGTASFTVAQNSGSVSALQNNTDLWWNPNESGWGLNIIQHGSGIIFATWFNYSSDNKATWYVVPTGQWTSPTEYRGPIYSTTGPEVNDTFNPSLVSPTLAGNVVLTFSATDSNRMTATFTINGKTVTKALQRQGF
jgi:hypothetical protein